MQLFTHHPATVGETYGEHFGGATYFGIRMIGAGILCLIHAVLPFLFVTNGSRTISHLHERMVTNRHRAATRPASGNRAVGAR